MKKTIIIKNENQGLKEEQYLALDITDTLKIISRDECDEVEIELSFNEALKLSNMLDVIVTKGSKRKVL